TASAPAFSASCDIATASAVELEPAPAITGARPRACSMHHSTTCWCSLCESVGLSPVVPTGTSPLVPSASCQSTSRGNAPSSREPFLKGVTSAVNEPWKLVLAVMARSSGKAGACPAINQYPLAAAEDRPGPSLATAVRPGFAAVAGNCRANGAG